MTKCNGFFFSTPSLQLRRYICIYISNTPYMNMVFIQESFLFLNQSKNKNNTHTLITRSTRQQQTTLYSSISKKKKKLTFYK